MRTFPAILALGLALPPLAVAQESYDLRREFEAAPVVGQTVRVEEKRDQQANTKVFQGPQVLQQEEEHDGLREVYELEVLAVNEAGDEITESVRTYQTLELLGQETRPVEVAGLKVKVTQAEDGSRSYEPLDGAQLPPELVELLDQEVARGPEAEGEAEKDKSPLLPKQPVAPGETWELPLDELLIGFGMDADGVDREQARATGTFKGLEETNGQTWAVIGLDIHLPFTTFQGLQCEQPIPLDMQGEGRVALGEHPGKTFTMHMTMQGNASPQPGLAVEFDIQVDMLEDWQEPAAGQ